jgi:hypothetical protein
MVAHLLHGRFPSPGAPAFEFAGARSFVVFEGTGFRFTEAPELPADDNEERWEENSYCKIPLESKIRTLIRRGG